MNNKTPDWESLHSPLNWSRQSDWIAAPQQERTQRVLSALLGAAARLFARDGFAATTMNAISAEAGVSVAAIYRRFSDKNAVFRGIVDIWSRAWTADSDRMWASVDWSERPARDIIQFHLDVVFSAYRSDPGLLLEIDRRADQDPEVGHIIAGMDRHAARSLYNHLSARLSGTSANVERLRERVDIAHWTLKATIAALMVRNKQENWPLFTPDDPLFEETLTKVFFAIFDMAPFGAHHGEGPAARRPKPIQERKAR